MKRQKSLHKEQNKPILIVFRTLVIVLIPRFHYYGKKIKERLWTIKMFWNL